MQIDPHFDESPVPHANDSPLEAAARVFSGAGTPIPAVQLLSNGRYHAMITNAGGGYSRWKDIALTRWREDSTRDNWGTFCYLRDVASGAFWSTTYQPALKPSAVYQADFSGTCAAFRCYEQGMDAHTDIAVSPEDDIEIRRIGITNLSAARKVIDLTSYAEVVLALAAADAAHPAFSNLFVQTEIISEQHGWDGEWYRRAYFDDGTPLGSARNSECRIDSIAQSWSVLSGAADAERARMAMDALDKHLVHRDDAVIQLLMPPFDKSTPDPGYIKAYVPGVRENGAQYTHAAVWAVMAFAAIGDDRRAWELLSIINPVNHAGSAESIEIYKVEPYVIASDVYALSPHTGRGGWTWYSGSAGWMYRLIVESLLGLRLEADKLRFAPCLPADWEEFKMHYRYRETVYHIAVCQTQPADGVTLLTVDGIERHDLVIPIVDDRQKHEVDLRIHIAQG